MISFASVFFTGDAKSAKENRLTEDYLRLINTSSDLAFLVASIATNVDFKVTDAELATPKITVAHDVTSWNVGGLCYCCFFVVVVVVVVVVCLFVCLFFFQNKFFT